MKRAIFILAGVVVAAASQATVFGFASSMINAAQEVNGSTSTAYGTGSFTVDDVTWQIVGSVATTGQAATSVTGFHIHNAPIGVNGPVIVDLTAITVNVFSAGNNVFYNFLGTLVDSNITKQAKLTQMIAGRTYFNMHTAANPGGAIRGQIDCITTPEPAAWGVMSLGLVPLLLRRRK